MSGFQNLKGQRSGTLVAKEYLGNSKWRCICTVCGNTVEITTNWFTLNSMYTYLSTVGDCYYIQYCGMLVGDVSLQDSGEISIVVCKEFQNVHIGRRCIIDMLALAKEKEMKEVKAKVFPFNKQSQKMFEAVGFKKVSEEWYSFVIDEK